MKYLILMSLLAIPLQASECYDEEGNRFPVPEGQQFVFVPDYFDNKAAIMAVKVTYPEPEPECRDGRELSVGGAPLPLCDSD